MPRLWHLILGIVVTAVGYLAFKSSPDLLKWLIPPGVVALLYFVEESRRFALIALAVLPLLYIFKTNPQLLIWLGPLIVIGAGIARYTMMRGESA